jgi:hypothetical protein
VTPDEFQRWARDKREQIEAAGEDLAEERKQREGDEGS